MPARHQIKSKPPREAPQPANGHREQFESIRAFNRADPSPELNQTQAGRQVVEDRRQNQTTVTRTRRPLPEPDDRRQNQTTVTRTRRPPFEQPASEHHERFNRSIDQIEPEHRYT